jgi:hypothetical protein
MESSPVSENCKMEVDLCTPAENLKKHYQEITPDNPMQPETTPLLGAKKVSRMPTYNCLVTRWHLLCSFAWENI